jgi:hypothetical protein
MRAKYAQIANYIGWARESGGYVKSCRHCGVLIYLHHDHDGLWRPYASWIAGDAAQGQWLRHDCGAPNTEVIDDESQAIGAELALLRDLLSGLDQDQPDPTVIATVKQRLSDVSARLDAWRQRESESRINVSPGRPTMQRAKHA